VTTFVSLGNATQPFIRLTDAVLQIVSILPQPVVVQHGNNPFQGSGCIARPFMEMTEFIELIETSELLILHAGAGSVIHAIQAGKVPVVMPRRKQYGEVVDDHQLEFAHALGAIGKVVVAEEPVDLVSAVQEAKKRQSMANSLNKRPPLVDLIAETLQAYAKTFA
jgi:UDP-N-acetylglucosamine transferase subunit ALG13